MFISGSSVSCRSWKVEMFFTYLVQLAGSYQGQENVLAHIPKKVYFQKQFICCYLKEACWRYNEQNLIGFLTAWSLQSWGQTQSWMKQVVHILFVCVFFMRMQTDFSWKILWTDELSEEFTTLAENYLECASLVQGSLICPGTENPMKNILTRDWKMTL